MHLAADKLFIIFDIKNFPSAQFQPVSLTIFRADTHCHKEFAMIVEVDLKNLRFWLQNDSFDSCYLFLRVEYVSLINSPRISTPLIPKLALLTVCQS